MMSRAARFILCGVALLAGAPVALAGGYDTPILYNARHIGMGGTGIAFANDASSLFHNPAGIAHVGFASITANFSPLIGKIQASPAIDGDAVVNTESDTTFAPFFMVGGTIRATKWLSFGVAAFPVASAGAEFNYRLNSSSQNVFDKTRLSFIEITPGIAFDLPGNLKIGFGYRIDIVSLQRQQTRSGATEVKFYDLDLKGVGYDGFRVGLQWQPIPQLQLGFVYRHKVTADIKGTEGRLLGQEVGDPKMTFTLPAKIGFGARGDLGPVGFAVDVELGLNSQNVNQTVETTQKGPIAVPPIVNEFRWSDAVTARFGVEYRLDFGMQVRAGYIFDGKTSNEHFPTAFGTPPAPTHSVTAGLGYRGKLRNMSYEVNLAYAYRTGKTTITSYDLDPYTSIDGSKAFKTNLPASANPYNCIPCSKAGDYSINLHGIYVDFSWYWDTLKEEKPAAAGDPQPN